MVTIKMLEIERPYHYIWLKHVSGFNLDEHCAKCLIGEYDSRINRNTLSYRDIVLPTAPYHYLCAVAGYKPNIHLAFEDAPGEIIEYEDQYYRTIINDARRIVFDAGRIDHNHHCAKIKQYNTCRNWWFANWIVNAPRE